MIALITGANGTLGSAVDGELKAKGFQTIHFHHGGANFLDIAAVDVLVNCAGIYGPIGSMAFADLKEWQKTIEVNLILTVQMCQLVLPAMIQRNYGKIINISGGGATRGRPNFSAYATSKAAVVRFTETLAEEVTRYHIDVNAVAPGMMRTAMTDKVLAAGPELAGEEEYNQATTCENGPEKAAQLIAFLASHASDGITGRLISVHDQWEGLTAQSFERYPDRYKLRRSM
jgi:3-oxoacyl-[acyl-carrier protein] reductase